MSRNFKQRVAQLLQERKIKVGVILSLRPLRYEREVGVNQRQREKIVHKPTPIAVKSIKKKTIQPNIFFLKIARFHPTT